LRGAAPRRYPVAIVGGGLTGLTLACDLALRGIPAVLLDEDDSVGVRGAASRGICYAQKSLEIFARLGIYERVLAKGVQWSIGRTFAGEDEVYSFDLQQSRVHDRSCQPAFVNLQQFYVEWFLVDRIAELGDVDVRWHSRVETVEQTADAVTLQVVTPSGRYALEAQWVVDCSGCHSVMRAQLGVPVHSNRMLDRWCISDVRFRTTPPAERWTWIEASFNDNRAVWQHRMADDVWRLDYQMACDADPEAISRPEVVRERLQRQFGADVEIELVWVGPYAYRSECLERFRAGRVLFAGDAAHVMSPFGARGGNSGIQDADNLAWKLVLVLDGAADAALLDSYDLERRAAAHDNLRVTGRTTRFLSPPTAAERVMRDAVIALAREHGFARSFVNTGRLSAPSTYRDSPLNVSPEGGRAVQNVAFDAAPGGAATLVDLVAEADHAVLCLVDAAIADERWQSLQGLARRHPLRCLRIARDPIERDAVILDRAGRLREQLQLPVGGAALLRPDLYLAGVVPVDDTAIDAALRRMFSGERG
jgi:3-(3-hydroxy-phenyl)propionate hydroxylase